MSTASAAVRSPSPVSDTIYVNNATGNDSWDGQSATWISGTTTGPKLSIKNATGTVNNGGTVKIANGIYTGENNTGITIDRNMTIIGQSRIGTVIDAKGKDIFHIIISEINVTILNLTFKNGTSSIGGAISNRGNLTVNNCNFTGNKATQVGGAIINQGTLIAKNCAFKDNIAKGNGGAIANSGICIITGCNFANNSAVSGGAVFNFESILTVKDCTFNYNTATGTDDNCGGAAIYSSGTLNVTGSTFKDNDAAASDSATIYNNGGTLTVTGSTFTGNEGGAIVNENNGNLNVTNSKFTGNSVIYEGGAIWNYGSCTVTGSTFKGNTANDNGGAIFSYNGTLTVNFCRIVGNTANDNGGAISNYNEQPVDARYNWWGSNKPDFGKLVHGNVDYTPWLYMTIAANPTTIKNGETSLITVSFNNLFDGKTVTYLDPAIGHIPDGTSVTFNTDKGSIGCKTIEKQTVNGIATVILTADETAGTAHVNAVTDSQKVNTEVTITPKSGLYLKVTPGKANPVVGDTVVYTLKVGNKGPDAAKDVVMTYVVPEGLEFADANVDMGEWNYDASTRTITWKIGDVPVGDPNMWLTLHVAHAGSYSINPVLITSTYDPTLNSDTESITVNALEKSNTVKAASKTIPLQKAGLPLFGIAMAILAVFSGLVMPKRK